MFAFIVRRLIGLVVVLFAITVVVFLIFFATPGVDPSARLAGRNPSPRDGRRGQAPVRSRPAAARSATR